LDGVALAAFFATKFLRGLANNPPYPMSEPQGRVSTLFYDRGYANYANLLAAGYRVRFLNDVERDNVSVADSEGGTITISGIERNGQVAIRLDK
jgi:hypothetical protein